MNFTEKNLKKITVFNSIALLVALILRVSQFEKATTAIHRTEYAICIVALMFGVFYSVKDYKKKSAHNYTLFMILYFVSSVLTLISECYDMILNNLFALNINLFKIVCCLIISICICVLAFGLDLGKAKSTKLSYSVLIFGIIKIVLDLFSNDLLTTIIPSISNLALSLILFVFVKAKYLDKESRGAK